MQINRWPSRRVRSMKVKDPLILVSMLALSGLGIFIGLSDGGSARETLVFVIFAMTMLYVGVR